jgi:uncharacterized protein involved in type VI secretion and phage assembly
VSPGVFGADRRDGLLSGVAVAVVTDDADPEGRSRLKVSFPRRDEGDGDGHWARLAVPLAGDSCGTYYQPAVGDEVLVAFGGGDPHRPFVVGSLWNGERGPPRTNENGDNDVREVRSRRGHSLAFDDSEKGGITIRTEAGNEVVVDDGGERIAVSDDAGENRIVVDSGEGTVAVEAAESIDLSASEITLDGGDVRIDADRTAEVDSDGTLSLESGGQLSVKSTAGLGVESTGILTIEGSLIRLN